MNLNQRCIKHGISIENLIYNEARPKLLIKCKEYATVLIYVNVDVTKRLVTKKKAHSKFSNKPDSPKIVSIMG